MVTFTDRKSIMKEWDKWREYIANGGKGSWPSDGFESLLDHFDEAIEKAKATQEKEEGKVGTLVCGGCLKHPTECDCLLKYVRRPDLAKGHPGGLR